MRRIYHIIIILAAAALSLNAAAQSSNGGIRVSGVTMTPDGNKVLLEMTVDIKDDAVTKYQSIAVAPALISGTNHAAFPYILVSGKNKTQIYDRKKKFRNTALAKNPPKKVVPIDKKNRGEKINYSAEIDYETWMGSAAIEVEFLLSSFAGELQVYAVEMNATHVITGPAETLTQIIYQPEPVSVVEIPWTDPAAVQRPGDTEYLSGTAYLDFTDGSHAIMPYFKRNAQELARFEEHVDWIMRNPNAEIVQVTIIGYASPEGRYSTNDILAFERSRSFAKYIQTKYGISLLYSRVGSVAEDWDTLRELVAESFLPNKSTVLAIIDNDTLAPDAKESKLRRLDNGRVWRILIDQMFPQLRRVEYTIDYTVK